MASCNFSCYGHTSPTTCSSQEKTKTEKFVNDLEEARKNILECLNIRERIYPQTHNYIVYCYSNLGCILHHIGSEEALKYLKRGIEVAGDKTSPACGECYENLAKYYSSIGNELEAHNYLELAKSIKSRISQKVAEVDENKTYKNKKKKNKKEKYCIFVASDYSSVK